MNGRAVSSVGPPGQPHKNSYQGSHGHGSPHIRITWSEHRAGTGLHDTPTTECVGAVYRARYYDPLRSRFVSEDPLRFAGGECNLYGYASNAPVGRIDPLGLTDLIYNHRTATLWIMDNRGQILGMFPAANNPDSRSRGSWGPGMYTFKEWIAHPESGPNGQYGSNGNFVFKVSGCTGCGIHAGRENTCDHAKRCGVDHATMGCIRSPDEATELLWYLRNSGDDIRTLWVIR